MLVPAFRHSGARQRGLWLGIALPALLLVCARTGLAQPPAPSTNSGSASPLGLVWVSSDPSCDGTAVAARALELVKSGVTPQPTEARAQVGREGNRWVVDLQTRSESSIGRRTLRGETCREIQQAIALLLAMIMESEATAEASAQLPAAPPVTQPPAAPPQPPAPPVSLNTPAEPELDEAPARPLPPAPREGLAWAVRTEGTAAWGLQPSLAIGLGGSLGIGWGPLELHAGGGIWPTSRGSILNRDGLFEMSRKVVGIAACYRVWDSGTFQILPCLAPEAIWLKWRSIGLSTNHEGHSNHLRALTAQLELRMQLVGPVFVSLTPGLTWEEPRTYRAKECQDCTNTPFFQIWALGPRLGAGVGARF